ncbi:MAG: hypothetical protein ACOX9R_18155 [Armatimonadota bacterium]|jgi:hypothetical protein
MRRFLLTLAVLALVASAASCQVNQEMIDRVAAGELTEARASWWGFDAEDSTEALQAAINSGAEKLIVEDMGSPWIVTPITLASNQEIVFEEGVEILAKRGEFKGTNDTLVTARNVENVTLRGYGATFRMWRDDYDNPELYTKAEWRHTLSLRGTNNINIYGLTLTESGGDGIYFGAGGGGNRNIHIKDLVCDKNYRQGISVITAENVLIEDTIMSNTAGTPPAAGIDFEPNNPNERLVNFVMRNCLTENNQGDGYEFYLPNMHAETDDVSIVIENCRSVNDRIGARVITGNAPDQTVGGYIRFINTEFVSPTGNGIMIGDKPLEGMEITFENCVVDSPAAENPDAAPILFTARQRAVRDVGGVDFGELLLLDPIEREPVAFTSMALGVNLGELTGTLIVERDGERTEVALTEELLARWAPPSDIPSIPLLRLADFEFAPVVADPPADPQYAPSGFWLRRTNSAMLYAEAGDEVVITASFQQVGRSGGGTANVTIISPSGEEVTVGGIPFQEEGEVSFTAPETGLYEVRAEPGGNRLTFTGSTHPLNLSTDGAPLRLISGGGELYLWVPEGTEEFGVVATGEGTGEAVRVRLFNPAGELVQEDDNVTAAVMLHGVLDQPSQGEAWRIVVSAPSDLFYEDHSISVRGVPPLLAPSPEALLMPR